MEYLLTNLSNIGNALGWTLIHFLWQGLLIFISYWLITRLFLKNKVTQQYWVGILFIAMSLIIPIREFIIQLHLFDTDTTLVQLIGNTISVEYSTGILNPLDLMILLIQKIIPYLVIFWLIAVTLISGHLFQSWVALLKLSRNPTSELPDNLLRKLEEVTEILKLKSKPIITISKKIDIPATFGYFKPVILLPLSLIAKLPQEQMEAILIHELCHIKRTDFLHNILQLLVETLFFYHPLIKWVSRDIRKVREQCCDEMVLNLKTNPITYANALTNIASIYNKTNNHDTSYLQIAASDGELFNRIKFLMVEKRAKSPLTNIMLALLFSISALIVFNHLFANNDINELTFNPSNNNELKQQNTQATHPNYTVPSIQQFFVEEAKSSKTIPVVSASSPINESTIASNNESRNFKPEVKDIEKSSTINQVAQNESLSLSTEPVIDLASAKETIAETEHTIPVKSKLKSFPKIIKKVNPVYSKLARSRGIEGTVILSFAIDKKGKVRKIKVDKSSPLKLLDGSARMALRKWRFDPNSISVNNINHRYQQIFSFNLSNYDLCMAGSIGTRLAPEQICQDL